MPPSSCRTSLAGFLAAYFIKSHRDYWIPKIERNMQKDVEVNHVLESMGYTVIRVWEHEIRQSPEDVSAMIERIIAERKVTMQRRREERSRQA